MLVLLLLLLLHNALQPAAFPFRLPLSSTALLALIVSLGPKSLDAAHLVDFALLDSISLTLVAPPSDIITAKCIPSLVYLLLFNPPSRPPTPRNLLFLRRWCLSFLSTPSLDPFTRGTTVRSFLCDRAQRDEGGRKQRKTIRAYAWWYVVCV